MLRGLHRSPSAWITGFCVWPALVGLAGIHAAQLPAPAARPDPGRVITAKLDAEGLSLLLVPMKVGAATFWCSVDSGGSWVFSIDRKKALQAGLQPNATGTIAGVGPSVARAERVRGVTAEIGTLALKDVTLVLVTIPKVVPDMDCVLGLGLLRDYVVQFDYVTPALRIFDADRFRPPDAPPLPFDLDRFRNPHMKARLHLGDGGSVEGDFMVDTGAGYYSAVLMKPFVDANRVSERIGAVVPRVSDTPGLVIAASRATGMTVGRFDLNGPMTALIQTPSRGVVEDGLIGTGFLTRFTVTFDYTRKQLWLEPNYRLSEPQLFDASGLELRRNADDEYAVASVAPGSASDGAGLQVGDLLRELDGIQARELTLGNIQARLSRAGTTCALKIDRQGVTRSITLELKKRL